MSDKVPVWVATQVTSVQWVKVEAVTLDGAIKIAEAQGHNVNGEASFKENGHVCALNMAMDGMCIICGEVAP